MKKREEPATERRERLLDLLGGRKHLAAVGKDRIEEMTLALCEAIVLTEKALSDKEAADRFGISVRTFRRWLEADPEAIECSVQDPGGEQGEGSRRWVLWELRRRWRGRGRSAA